VRVAMQKVEGVQSVRVSLKEGLTTVELKPANKVTLAHLRTIIKNSGFVSRNADVVANGIVRDGQFEVSGTAERLTPSPAARRIDDGRWNFTVGP
jgi:copper chaperone CopZ